MQTRAGELELTPIGVELNGSRRYPLPHPGDACSRKESGNIFRVGMFRDYDRLTLRTPHGECIVRAGRQT